MANLKICDHPLFLLSRIGLIVIDIRLYIINSNLNSSNLSIHPGLTFSNDEKFQGTKKKKQKGDLPPLFKIKDRDSVPVSP